MRRQEPDVRVTVRLRPNEAQVLDELVAKFKGSQALRQQFRRNGVGRNYYWTRADILRLGLGILERQTMATSGLADGAIAVADNALAPRQPNAE